MIQNCINCKFNNNSNNIFNTNNLLDSKINKGPDGLSEDSLRQITVKYSKPNELDSKKYYIFYTKPKNIFQDNYLLFQNSTRDSNTKNKRFFSESKYDKKNKKKEKNKIVVDAQRKYPSPTSNVDK